MADAINVFPPAFRVLDEEGNPVSGAKIRFWVGGTSTPKNVYSDPNLSSSLGSTVYTRADGYPVASEGGSTTVAVWIGAGLFDVDVVDENDVTIYPRKINQKGALDTSGFITSDTTSTLIIPTNAISSDAALDADSRGKLLNVNTGGGNVALTLDAASDLGDGWNVEIRKAAAANVLLIQSAGETIHFNGQAHTSLALTGLGEGLCIRTDGAEFYVTGYTEPLRNTTGVIVITDRISSAPGSPVAGQRYLVTSSFSTFETHDIIEYAAAGFIEYTPTTDCGWLAYVQDEDAYYAFQGAAWEQVLPIADASDTVKGRIELATAAELKTGTDAARGIVPGLLANHPLVPKAWVVFQADGTVLARSGASTPTVAKDATGIYTITWGVTFSSAHYHSDAMPLDGGGGFRNVQVTARTTTTTTFIVENSGGTDSDPTSMSCIAFGHLA